MKVKVAHVREGFFEVAEFLNNSGLRYWIGRDLVNQVYNGEINDVTENHDIDFHILEEDKDVLRERLIENGFAIEEEKRYKIQIKASDSTLFEFVFLIDIDPRSDIYIQFSRRTCYISPKRLFGEDRVRIGDVEVPTPSPLDEYVSYCCAKEDREAEPAPEVGDVRLLAGAIASDLSKGSQRQDTAKVLATARRSK